MLFFFPLTFCQSIIIYQKSTQNEYSAHFQKLKLYNQHLEQETYQQPIPLLHAFLNIIDFLNSFSICLLLVYKKSLIIVYCILKTLFPRVLVTSLNSNNFLVDSTGFSLYTNHVVYK